MAKFEPGHSKVGGRKPGSRNKPAGPAGVTPRVARLLNEMMPEGRLLNPLEAMMICLQWSAAEQDRTGMLAAAAAAAPYIHPRLNATTMTVRHEYQDKDDQALLIEAEALEQRISAMRRRLSN
jgi:hypothetical protein